MPSNTIVNSKATPLDVGETLYSLAGSITPNPSFCAALARRSSRTITVNEAGRCSAATKAAASCTASAASSGCTRMNRIARFANDIARLDFVPPGGQLFEPIECEQRGPGVECRAALEAREG